MAAAENNAIGKDNQLIWHLSDDLKRFKTLPTVTILLWGAKLLRVFQNLYPIEPMLLLQDNKITKCLTGVIVVNNLEEAIKISKKDSQPFIIGGGEIYKQAMHYC